MHVVATAGHVDHGKSTLVRALTGMEPDRWAEERRRGMTIDLGYAWAALPGGEVLAFVDVPGHQRFIGNMLAGLGPAPAVMVVVAADEGWRRQSGEHLAAVDALGLTAGVLAVTRSDLADPGPARAEALEHLGRSSLREVEAVAVSGATGAGLEDLRGALGRLVARLPVPRADVVERLRRHPLARALRVDKLVLAALEATLRGPATPTWTALLADLDGLLGRCEAVAAQVGGTVVPSDGAVGGGGAPGQVLPGWAVALPAACAPLLRAGDPCVVGRVERDRCLLDLRCIPPVQDALLVEAVRRACTS